MLVENSWICKGGEGIGESLDLPLQGDDVMGSFLQQLFHPLISIWAPQELDSIIIISSWLCVIKVLIVV